MALTFVNIHKCKCHRGWCGVKCGDDGVGRAFCECKLRWERVVGLIRFNERGTQDLKIFLQRSGDGRMVRPHTLREMARPHIANMRYGGGGLV